MQEGKKRCEYDSIFLYTDAQRRHFFFRRNKQTFYEYKNFVRIGIFFFFLTIFHLCLQSLF